MKYILLSTYFPVQHTLQCIFTVLNSVYVKLSPVCLCEDSSSVERQPLHTSPRIFNGEFAKGVHLDQRTEINLPTESSDGILREVHALRLCAGKVVWKPKRSMSVPCQSSIPHFYKFACKTSAKTFSFDWNNCRNNPQSYRRPQPHTRFSSCRPEHHHLRRTRMRKCRMPVIFCRAWALRRNDGSTVLALPVLFNRLQAEFCWASKSASGPH